MENKNIILPSQRSTTLEAIKQKMLQHVGHLHNNRQVLKIPKETLDELIRFSMYQLNPKPVLQIEQVEIWKNLKLYLLNDIECEWDLKKGLFLYGEPGRGKTMIFNVLRMVLNSLNVSFKIAKSYEIRNLVLKSKDICDLEKYFKGDNNAIWCFDDLGMDEKMSIYGNRYDPVYEILFHRHDRRLLTHATSNLSPKDLLERYDARLESRMHEMFNFIEVGGVDLRKYQKYQ